MAGPVVVSLGVVVVGSATTTLQKYYDDNIYRYLTLWRPLLQLPDRIKPSFVIFDIRALWRSAYMLSRAENGKSTR